MYLNSIYLGQTVPIGSTKKTKVYTILYEYMDPEVQHCSFKLKHSGSYLWLVGNEEW